MRGSGTQTDPYIIENVTDLQNVDNNLSAYYELGRDIDASITSTWNGGAGFSPIGLASLSSFTGHFDGRGYTISHLYINRPTQNKIGLFSSVAGAVIQNVTIEDANIVGWTLVGSLIGDSDTGFTLINCHAKNVTVSGPAGSGDMGGLIGYASSGSNITGCSSSGTVYASGDVGGLIGIVDSSTITGCSSSATVTAAGDVGGLIGEVLSGSNITGCSSSGTVTGNSFVGGLIGKVGSVCNITRCSSSGTVTGNGGYVGGLIGAIGGTNCTITSCHSDVPVTGLALWRVGGLVGESWGNNVYTDCYATGDVHCTDPEVDYVGGLIGRGLAGSLTRCYATGNVTGGYDSGGLCGYSHCTLNQCFALGDVTSGKQYVGGLCGTQYGAVTECYARGNVTGDASQGGGGGVGGLIGYCDCAVTRCYSTGKITQIGGTLYGGLIGEDGGTSTFTGCFWDTETSGMASSVGGTGLTTMQMKSPAQFLAAGWDFISTWGMTPNCNGGYPCLHQVQGSCIFVNALLITDRIFNVAA